MEHKLITGGEQYLPFARSRIKAMRATGLKYASQKFEIDGCSIKVCIEPGQEYITLDGGEVPLRMDSGVIDVGHISELSPARFLPGVKIDTAPTADYEAVFTDASTKKDASVTPALTPYFTNPGKTSAGQLAGIIAAGVRIKGLVRKDGVAESFARQTVMNDDVPPMRTPNMGDGDMVDKKRTGDKCPPSMFTGKARLFAQAMLGQYMYARASGAEPDDANATPGSGPDAGGVPQLLLVNHRDSNVERVADFVEKTGAARAAAQAQGLGLVFDEPYEVTLNVSSGVHLDPLSGKHWLINPTPSRVKIYPLVSSKAGESLRKWLRPAMAGKLAAEDRERLEAYILSACHPHVELMQTVNPGLQVNDRAMGYGWHWNWSGTRADIVHNLGDRTRNDGSASSTHYRLAVTGAYDPETKATAWSASASIVEGPVVWATRRSFCCFTNPVWLDRYQGFEPFHPPVYWSVKTPWKYDSMAELYDSDAPVYAFYKRDELQLCRFSCKVVEAEKPTVSFAPATWAHQTPQYEGDTTSHVMNYSTTGLESAFFKSRSGKSKHYVFRVSCGGSSVEATHAQVETVQGTVDSVKTEIATAFDPSYHVTPPGSFQLRSGRPVPGSGDSRGPYSGASVEGWKGPENEVVCTWTSVYSTTTIAPAGAAGAIVPFYDAEVFYLIQDTSEQSVETQRYEKTLSGFYVGYDYGWADPWPYSNYPGSLVGPSRFEAINQTRSLVSERHLSDKEDEWAVVKTVTAHYGGGATSGGIPTSEALSMFGSELIDNVEAMFKTLSSASKDPVLFGLVTKDWPDPTPVRPVIVGWI